MATAAKRLPTGEVAADGAFPAGVGSGETRPPGSPLGETDGNNVGGGAAGRSRGKPALAGQTSAPGALVAAKLTRQAGKSPWARPARLARACAPAGASTGRGSVIAI